MPNWYLQLAQQGLMNENDGNGNDLPGGAPQSSENDKDENGEPQDPPKDVKDDAKPETKPENKSQITDKEAELLKEVMKRKESEKSLKAELASLKTQLGDLDIEKAKELLRKQAEDETKALEAKGEYERLKQRMAEEHQKEVNELKERIKALEGEITTGKQTIDNLTIGNKFSQSAFISDELVLTSTKARAFYGDYFDIDENGEVVGYDKPRGVAGRTALVDAYGRALDFDLAMRKIIDSDPEKEHLIKAKVKSGAGSNSKPKGNTVDTGRMMSSQDKILAGLGNILQENSGKLGI